MTKRGPRQRGASRGAKPGLSLNRADFPALTAFLKGYLHEDFSEEHGSTRGAAEAFCRDASCDERRQLAEEMARLVEAAHGAPLASLRRFVTGGLGGGWTPRSANDLREMLMVIRPSRQA